MEQILDRFRWWGNRPFLLLGCFFLFVALTLAAIDQVPAMADATLFALLFLAIHGIAVVYFRLPADHRNAFSRRFLRRTTLVASIAAILVASAYWVLLVTPLGIPYVLFDPIRTLDVIPSAFALLLPVEARSGFHHYFRNMTYCFPGPYWWETMRYLRTAIPAYAFVFFFAACGVRLAGATLRSWRG